MKKGKETIRVTITLPVAQDALGRWCGEHGAAIEMSCTLGQWCATVRWRRLISYSDDHGMHRETHEVSRYDPVADKALAAALLEAMGQTSASVEGV